MEIKIVIEEKNSDNYLVEISPSLARLIKEEYDPDESETFDVMINKDSLQFKKK